MTIKLNDLDLKLLNSKYNDGKVFETNIHYIEYNGENFNLLGLKKAPSITAKKAHEINLPLLEDCFEIDTGATRINLPLLENLNMGYFNNVIRLSLPKLKECVFLSSSTAIGVDVPLLEGIQNFYCNSAVTINLPSLVFVPYGGIKSAVAKKIVIPKHLEKRLTNIPEDCEIIHPENIQQESFKSFFYK